MGNGDLREEVNLYFLSAIKHKLNSNKGIAVLEVVLLLVVFVGLVLIFKDNITELVRTIFEKVSQDAGNV